MPVLMLGGRMGEGGGGAFPVVMPDSIPGAAFSYMFELIPLQVFL